MAPAVLAIALTAAVSACGSVAAPRSGHPAAEPGRSGAAASGSAASGTADSAASSVGAYGVQGQAVGTSTAAVPPAARRVQCPLIPLVRLPDAAVPEVSVQPQGPVQPDGTVQPGEPIPPGFRPVAVVECVTVTSLQHSVFHVELRRQAAIAGLGRLLAALREPSAPRPKGPLPACMAPATSWPWFVLVGADGQVVHPVIPVGLCGEPIEAVVASLHSLHWIILGTVALHPGPFRPPLHGGPIHDITPGITVPN